MARSSRKRYGIALLALLVTLAPQICGSQPSRASGLDVSFSSVYSSNPFNLKDEWIQVFDSQRSANDRFAGLETPWDFVSRLKMDASTRWKSAQKRRLNLGGSVSYRRYHQNSIASYVEFGMQTQLRVAKHDRTKLSARWIPDRYKRNYEHPDLTTDDYLSVHYGQYELELSHSRRVAKNWRLGFGIEHAGRDFDPLFSTRDRALYSAGVEVERRLSKRAALTLASAWAAASSPTGIEDGVEVDRSFNEARFAAQLESRAGSWKAEFASTLRLRTYATNNAADVSRFDRNDTYWGVSTKWSRRLGLRQKVHVTLAYSSKTSNRPADLDDPDAVPYHRVLVGAGIGHEF